MILTLAIVGVAGLAQGLDERGFGDRASPLGQGRRRRHSLLERESAADGSASSSGRSKRLIVSFLAMERTSNGCNGRIW